MVCALLFCTACDSGTERSHFSDLGPSDPSVYPASPDQVTLRKGRTIGSLEGDLAFGRIAGLALSRDGRLAIGDTNGCQVTIVDVNSLEVLGEFGSCGDGPLEFRSIRSLSFEGENLWVYDDDRSRLVGLSPTGTVVGESSLGALRASSVTVLNASTAVASVSLRPAQEGEGEERLLALIDPMSGEVLDRWLEDADVSRLNRRPLLLRSAPSCASRTAGGARMVVANPWTLQWGIYEAASPAVLVTGSDDIPWIRPIPYEGQTGSFRPLSPPPGLVCGPNGFMMVYREIGYGQPGPPVLRGYFEYRSWDGSAQVIDLTESPERESFYYGSIGALGEDRVFFYTNSWAIFPTIYEYLIDDLPLQR